MKERFKKILAVSLAGAMAAGVLAGCGGSGGTASSSAADTNTSASSASSGSSQTSGAVKEVSVWHYFEHEAQALEKVAEDYNSSQDKIHITCTYVSREELMKQYTIGAVSGELPDIGMVDSPDMASYISLGVFEDIDDQLQEWGELDKFYAGPLSSCMDSEGKLHGLPNNSNCLALLCNMDILNAAGVDTPPTTWDEFYEVCKKTTDAANSVYGFAMSAIGNEEGTFQYIPWLYSTGADVTTLDSEGAAKSLDFLGQLVSEGLMSKEVVNWGQGDALNAFAAGKAAMVESGTWQIAQFDSGDVELNCKYKYALLPKDKENASVIGGENFGVCAGTEAKDECVDFLKYMMTAQNNADWCETAGKLPVRSDAAELKDFWTADERYAVFNEAMNSAVARGPHESWPTISEAIYTAEQAALLGEKSGTDAMAEAVAVVNPILEEVPIAAVK
ncbi:MAG: ABC transporter substrate-binding protein [Lachnospiraceae bacterium]|nr:ABC transporter substrate-binding protein [Lachnospiraceae bacterium]